MTTKVIVKPVEREKWHGKKGSESFARPIVLSVPINTNGSYSTGLSESDEKRLEKELKTDLSSIYNPLEPNKYWSNLKIKLNNGATIFDTKNPNDEVKVSVLKKHDLIANNPNEITSESLFVIFSEQEDIEIKASKAAIRRKVVIETDKLSKDRKSEIVQIVLGISVKNQSNDFIDLKLDEAIDFYGPEKMLSLIQRDKSRVAVHSMVLEAEYKGILRKKGSAYYYMDSDQLGFDLESTIDYLQDPKNQALKVQILEKLN